MADVRFTPQAEDDLYAIWAGIAAENVTAADRLFRRIMDRIALAANTPSMGAPRPELSATARILVEGRYVVIYEPLPAGVNVIAIVHGMRDPGRWLG